MLRCSRGILPSSIMQIYCWARTHYIVKRKSPTRSCWVSSFFRTDQILHIRLSAEEFVFFVACTHSRISYQELSIHISRPLLLNPAGTDRLEASQAGTAHHLCESTNYSPNPTCLLLIGSKI